MRWLDGITDSMDAEAKIPIRFFKPDMKNQLIGKDPDSGKDRAEGEGGERG